MTTRHPLVLLCLIFAAVLLPHCYPAVGAVVQWEKVCDTPIGYTPQGLAVRNGILYLSAHRNDRESTLFQYEQSGRKFKRLFAFPADATHTSGIAFSTSGKTLVGVDYNSDKIYILDFVASRKANAAIVQSEIESGFSGTSACCFVQRNSREYLVVTDFGHSTWNQLFRFNIDQQLLEKVEGLSYRNNGFSQGITIQGDDVYETGNGLFGSYIICHSLDRTLERGRISPRTRWRGPGRMIEDIVIIDGLAFIADEHENAIYSARLSASKAPEYVQSNGAKLVPIVKKSFIHHLQ